MRICLLGLILSMFLIIGCESTYLNGLEPAPFVGNHLSVAENVVQGTADNIADSVAY